MVREARERVRRGDLGELLTIQGSYLQDWLLEASDDNWRVDARVGGPSRAFADIGSHLVDLLEFVSGDRITRLTAVKRVVHGRIGDHREVNTEDSVALAFEGSGGAIGTIGTLLVSQVAPGRKDHLVLELNGRSESIRFEQERPDELWLGRRTGSTLLPHDPNQLAPEAARLIVLPAGHPPATSLGAAVVGTLFASRLTDILGATSSASAQNSLTPDAVRALPAAARTVNVNAYSDALTPVFLYMVPLMALAAVLLMFVSEKPLATTIERDLPLDEPTGLGTPVLATV